MIYAKRWRPSEYHVDPFEEIMIEDRSVKAVKAKVLFYHYTFSEKPWDFHLLPWDFHVLPWDFHLLLWDFHLLPLSFYYRVLFCTN